MSAAPVRARKSKKPVLVIAIAVAIAIAVVVGIALATSASSRADDAMPEALLPDATSMGAVELNVRDLEGMRDYYVSAVGLEVLHETETAVTLGLDTPLLELTIGEGDATASAMEAGLYHSAILYSDEAALAQTIYNIATIAPQSYQGSADHAVSHAFYFVDPEGNGLELYVDTPRSEWKWVDGEVQMGSAPLDPNVFIQEHLGESAGDVTMGHVHLKVGDLAQAESFYADLLGFAVTARSDGALFYAAGGYHHHLATNTWQSQGAGPRTNETGLGSVTIVLPGTADVQAVVDRLVEANYAYDDAQNGVTTVDPWGNTVHLVTS